MEQYWIPLLEMEGSSNAEVDLDSSSAFSASTQDDSNNVNSDDAFLEIQRATITVGKIHNYVALPGADFISTLSECCNWYELRYIRNMMVSLVKKENETVSRPLVERKDGSNLKEKLLKDIYNMYLFGEGSSQSLPENMTKCDSKYVEQCTQTDTCLSSTIFASKLDLDTLKNELMHRIYDLRHECPTLPFQDLPCQIRCFPPFHSQPFALPSFSISSSGGGFQVSSAVK